MGKKQVNFRLDTDDIKSLDKLVEFLSYDIGVKFDRTKVVEKLIRDAVKTIKSI